MERREVIYSAYRVRTIISQALNYGIACGLLDRDCTLNDVGYTDDEIVSHGWWATFRTLSDEQLGIRGEYAEQQLAHRVKDPLGRAYNKTLTGTPQDDTALS